MARSRKALVEGAEALRSVAIQGSATELVAATRKADPVPGNNGDALERLVSYFQSEFPELWEELALCPLQHGLSTMIEKLKA